MTKLSKHQIAAFAANSDEQLRRFFDAIGKHPDHRVKAGKNKGFVKQAWARHGDAILAELDRRKQVRLSAGPVVETLRLYATRQFGFEAAHAALTNLGIESREAEDAIHGVERVPEEGAKYNGAQQSYIDGLVRDIEGSAVPQYVCDYLGRVDGEGMVGERSSLNRRFGTRDAGHVQAYKLRVIEMNSAARRRELEVA